jgi:hypothetical protein
MILRQCVFCVLAAAGSVNFVQAQPVQSCPAGQAVSALQPNGTPVQCIPVPPPVDLGPLELAIVQETAERKQADADIRASITEASIVGRYAFTGTQACLTSSRGFNADLSPTMPSAPPPVPPASTDPTIPPVSTPPPSIPTFVSQTVSTATGFRTFNADHTGTLELASMNLGYPAIGFTNFNGFVSASVSGGFFSATTSTQGGTFQWDIVDGNLIVDDNVGNLGGTITSGGNHVGWSVTIRNLPRQVGMLGKDLKMLTLTNETPGVEVNVLTSPAGAPLQVIETPRICVRERTLRKL